MELTSLISSLAAPNDLWTIIINWIQGAVSNYGWTIILFTLLVKVATTPLDFMVKLTSKKQILVQKKCAPDIAKLKKKFGNDQKTLQVQTNALYKREGLKQGTGCLIMLVNLVLTMVIFFTLYSSLRNVSAYEAIKQYESLQTTYTTEFVNTLRAETGDETIVDRASAENWAKRIDINDTANYDEANYATNVEKYKKATDKAVDAVNNNWNEVKENWLWVENIWVADATTSPFPTYANLKTISSNKAYSEYVINNINESDYNNISAIISTTSRPHNGYYILAVLVGLSTFASQLIGDLHNKLKNKKANTLAKLSEANGGSAQPTMKVMKIVLPIIMVIFALTTASSFSIYLLASSVFSLALGEVTTLIVDLMTKKQRLAVEASLEKEADRLIRKGKIKG